MSYLLKDGYRIYWVVGDNNVTDEWASFCKPCAEKRIKECQTEDPEGGYVLDFGFVVESYYEAYCVRCGCGLGQLGLESNYWLMSDFRYMWE